MLNKFKRWLRSLSPLQAAIFYFWTAFTIYVVVYDLPNLIVTIGSAAMIAAFGIWLTGIRTGKLEPARVSSDERGGVKSIVPTSNLTKKLAPQSGVAPNRQTVSGELNLIFLTIPKWWWVLFGINYIFYVNMLWLDRGRRIRRAAEGDLLGDLPTELEKLGMGFRDNWLAGAEQFSYFIAFLTGAFIFSLVPSLFGLLSSGISKCWRSFLGWIMAFFTCIILAIVTLIAIEQI
jgi:hypothetical protein